MVKRVCLIAILAVISCQLFAGKWDNKTADLKGKKILVFTKNGEGFVHDNIEANVNMFLKLGEQYDFTVDSTSNSAVFSTSDLFQYDAVVFANTNNRVFENEKEKEGLIRFNRLGKGILGIHIACGTEREWDWFKQMIGGTFDFHPPLQKFNVRVVDDKHPSTRDIPPVWEVEDELYIMKEMNPTVRVLMVSDFSSPDFEHSKPIPNTFGTVFPSVWCNEFDGGRQWFTALGHKKEDYSDSLFINHIVGGLQWVLVKKDTIRVLAIGNSFSQDAVENYLYELGESADVAMVIGNAAIGGCSLERHWKNAEGDLPEYTYFQKDQNGQTVTKNFTLLSAITREAWDVITLQQVSGRSGRIDTYFPYLEDLAEYVREHAINPDVTLAFHQTWAYETNSTHADFPFYQSNQDTMYHAIVNTVNKATEQVGIGLIIPSGTAIQNGRNRLPDAQFCRDGYHLNMNLGRYTAACTWFEALTGKSVVGNRFKPEKLSAEEALAAQWSAHKAVLYPDKVCKFPCVSE